MTKRKYTVSKMTPKKRAKLEEDRNRVKEEKEIGATITAFVGKGWDYFKALAFCYKRVIKTKFSETNSFWQEYSRRKAKERLMLAVDKATTTGDIIHIGRAIVRFIAWYNDKKK